MKKINLIIKPNRIIKRRIICENMPIIFEADMLPDEGTLEQQDKLKIKEETK